MRYERKYRIEQIAPQVVEQVVRMHPVSFRPAFPDRQVNNIYFDTAAFSALHENEGGAAQRKKHRVRWYGAFMHILQKPVLEVKVKDNLLGYKQTKYLENFALSDLGHIQQQVNAQITDYQPLNPVLLNSYQRSYWVTANGNIRLTIDWDMQFHPLYMQANFKQYHLTDPAVIVELKYHETYESEAMQVMQYLPFRITKNSKYVNGMSFKI